MKGNTQHFPFTVSADEQAVRSKKEITVECGDCSQITAISQLLRFNKKENPIDKLLYKKWQPNLKCPILYELEAKGEQIEDLNVQYLCNFSISYLCHN